MDFVCFNGNFLPANEPLFTSLNRSFRYGDGIFETIKVYQSKICLEEFHFDRLLLGLKMLQIENLLSLSALSQLILEVCQKNNCLHSARVRLAVFRNQLNKSEFVIEAFPLLQAANQWNEKGLTVDLYPYARKSPDAFSNLKTANFLPYVLADIFAKENAIDDAIVLNTYHNVADSAKANVFLIKKNAVFTPALHQGCVSGVMRRFLLDELKKNNYQIHQKEISEQDLWDADEIFLTNSIYDIRWVEKFRDKNYSSQESFSIYQKIIVPCY